VEELTKNRELLREIRTCLEKMPDLERLASRISGNLATPRDFSVLRKALLSLKELREGVEGCHIFYHDGTTKPNGGFGGAILGIGEGFSGGPTHPSKGGRDL
jgi:hypothetical protein